MEPVDLLKKIQKDTDFVNLSKLGDIIIDLRYAGTDNFMGEDVYREFNQAFLHSIAFEKLSIAIGILRKQKPGWKFRIFDASRPRYVQFAMWSRLQGSAEQQYLADPVKGSIHSYGFAVDLSLVDQGNTDLDMGTPFDQFSPLSEPRVEKQFLNQGKLSQQQLDNRILLRNIMTQAGFSQLPIEWWHYDALPADEVRQHYSTID